MSNPSVAVAEVDLELATTRVGPSVAALWLGGSFPGKPSVQEAR
jgi:hypothetical protein